MRADRECFRCLQRLADQVVDLSTKQKTLRLKIRKKLDEVLKDFSPGLIPTDLSNRIHRVAKLLSSNPDPYREVKLQEMEISRRMSSRLGSGTTLREKVETAALGNVIDYFVDQESLEESLSQRPEFALDGIDELAKRLRRTRRILYLPDNAGEVFFDIPLLQYLSGRAELFYAVKSEPLQNDLSLNDLLFLRDVELPAIVIKGPPTVGVYLSQAPAEFSRVFDTADLVISKGMANYETLSERSDSRIFYILRAKCKPVARSLGIKVQDFIASFL